MQKRGISDDVWITAFSHMAALVLGIETLRSLESIAKSALQVFTEDDLNRLNFSRLKAFDPTLPETRLSLVDALRNRLWVFESWVSNVRTVAIPLFLPGNNFLLSPIEVIKGQIGALSESAYFVYIDEYENLSPSQQMIVNTWLKHSEYPLILNVAMKRNAFKVKQTMGNEMLSDIHDYRTHDLEAYLSEEFDLFASEVLFLNLALDQVLESPVNKGLCATLKKLQIAAMRSTLAGFWVQRNHSFPMFLGMSSPLECFAIDRSRKSLKKESRQPFANENPTFPAPIFQTCNTTSFYYCARLVV